MCDSVIFTKNSRNCVASADVAAKFSALTDEERARVVATLDEGGIYTLGEGLQGCGGEGECFLVVSAKPITFGYSFTVENRVNGKFLNLRLTRVVPPAEWMMQHNCVSNDDGSLTIVVSPKDGTNDSSGS